jgi:hypothetical protein
MNISGQNILFILKGRDVLDISTLEDGHSSMIKTVLSER